MVGEPLKRRGLKRAAVNTLGSQDRRRIGPGPVAGHVGFATRFTTVTRGPASARPGTRPVMVETDRFTARGASRDQPRSPGRAHPGRGRRSAAVSTGDPAF